MVAQKMLLTYKMNIKKVLSKKIGFDDSSDVTKCLQQNEIHAFHNVLSCLNTSLCHYFPCVANYQVGMLV